MTIRFENVWFIYESFNPAHSITSQLQDLSFEIRQGEMVGLVGRSGSGKTTLMQLFNGLLLPARGRICVDDEDINSPHYDLVALRRRLGVVFQFPEMQFFAATVEEEIAFGPQQQNFRAEEITRCVTQALHIVGLEENYGRRNPFTLSQGEKRRVALASVLAMQPAMLVLDEPTASLDARGVAEVRGLLKSFHATGKTLVVISHDVDLIADLCPRVLILEEGRLIYDGATKALWGSEATPERQNIWQNAKLPLPRSQRLREHLATHGVAWDDIPILKERH
ncbi:MAG: Energy-coupling factor transporter ATP-binding protein EcfA2 [bacterium]|nr:Energy-coupling factor transporter ATP-binding protein EcfA2 [bacterium]